MDFGLLILGIIICSGIFAADILFQLGAIALFYIIFLVSVFMLSKKNVYLISSFISSIVLTGIGWVFQTRSSEVYLDIGGVIQATLNYEGLFRVVTMLVILFIGIILLKQRAKDEELTHLNETLELRILARTAVSENKAKRLEEQIKALQNIRNKKTDEAIVRLDNVIAELKDLNRMENPNG